MKTTLLAAFCLLAIFIPAHADTSGNWSGYDSLSSTDETFTEITGMWNVPTMVATPGIHTYASFWIGIDGVDNSLVEQCGVACDVTADGNATYTSWYEFYPADQKNIDDFVIHPGDLMSAEIIYLSDPSSYTITMEDITDEQDGEAYSFSQTFDTAAEPNDSAEWIAEATAINGDISTLANYGSVTFTDATAELGGTVDQLSDLDPKKITMVQDSTVVSVPSDITDGDAFTVVYAVPEPSTCLLCGVGGLALIIAHRRSQTA